MAELMLVNPRRRKRAAPKRKTVTVRRKKRATPAKAIRRKRNPAPRVAARRRVSNPRKTLMNSQITPAFIAATGALSLDVLLGFLPVPETVKTGPFRHIVKGVGAIGLGMAASALVGKKTGEQMATGALTVVMHGAMKEVAQGAMPNLNLGFYNAGYNVGVGEYVNGVGAYIPDSSESTYLNESLSTPFAGPSSAQAVEQRMASECEARR